MDQIVASSIQVRPYAKDIGDMIVSLQVSEDVARSILSKLYCNVGPFKYLMDVGDENFVCVLVDHVISPFQGMVSQSENATGWEICASGQATFESEDDLDGTKIPTELSTQNVLDAAIVLKDLLKLGRD